MRAKLFKLFGKMAMAGALFGVTLPAWSWSGIVFDPTNYAQNIITAAKAVRGEIYQNTNILYQYNMMKNQLLQATGLDQVSRLAQLSKIGEDLKTAIQLKDSLTQLYGNLQDGAAWLNQAQAMISTSGKSPTQWLSDMGSLYTQGNRVARSMFNQANTVMSHTQELAQRRQQLQSQLALSPTQQATAELTTHYLDVVASQNGDLLQMIASQQQKAAQDSAVATTEQKSSADAFKSIIDQQAADRAKLNALGH